MGQQPTGHDSGKTRSSPADPKLPTCFSSPPRSCDPEPSILVFRNTEYLPAQHFREVGRNLNMAGAEKGQATRCSDPERAGRMFKKAVRIFGGQTVWCRIGSPLTV